MTAMVALQGEMTVRAILRRRLTLAILVVMPVAFYFVSHDSVGRAVRSLVFGLSWALGTVAFFASMSGRQTEPRLELAGWRRSRLHLGRLGGLVAIALVLTALFGALVAADQEVRTLPGVILDFAVTGVVAIGVGSAVGAVLRKELEGTLVLFFLAGLQAVVNPFDTYARALPFWSSRELGTWAIDGPAVGSLSDGLLHAALTVVVCGCIVVVASHRQSPSRPGRSVD